MKMFANYLLVPAMVVLVSACGKTGADPRAGQNFAVLKGCSACHAVDETPKIGPSWVGLYGSKVELEDGSFVIADEAYLVESTKNPNAKIVLGYTKGAMPMISLSEDELRAIVAYIKSIE
jgi:cytochrome c2